METATPAKRPPAITGICVIGALGVVALAWLAFSGNLYGAPDWYPPYLTVSAIAGATAMVGLFLMRKWGLLLYGGLFAVNQIVLLATGLWSVQSALVPVIVIIVASQHYGRMR
ncbi:MAG: hypothetical protein Q8R82_20910 [Hyphomonadaceae bacterium]|nr:hypothetical protein [Hyphomonadaceae bacterium]